MVLVSLGIQCVRYLFLVLNFCDWLIGLNMWKYGVVLVLQLVIYCQFSELLGRLVFISVFQNQCVLWCQCWCRFLVRKLVIIMCIWLCIQLVCYSLCMFVFISGMLVWLCCQCLISVLLVLVQGKLLNFGLKLVVCVFGKWNIRWWVNLCQFSLCRNGFMFGCLLLCLVSSVCRLVCVWCGEILLKCRCGDSCEVLWCEGMLWFLVQLFIVLLVNNFNSFCVLCLLGVYVLVMLIFQWMCGSSFSDFSDMLFLVVVLCSGCGIGSGLVLLISVCRLCQNGVNMWYGLFVLVFICYGLCYSVVLKLCVVMFCLCSVCLMCVLCVMVVGLYRWFQYIVLVLVVWISVVSLLRLLLVCRCNFVWWVCSEVCRVLSE